MQSERYDEYDPDCQLSAMLDHYRDERERYWEQLLNSEDIARAGALYEPAESFADWLIGTAEDGLVGGGVTPEFADLLDEAHKYIRSVTSPTDEVIRSLPANMQSQVRRWFARIPPTPIEDSLDDASNRPPRGSALRLAWEKLCIHLGSEFVDNRMVAGCNRIFMLATLVADGNPSVETLTFLKHIGRCFIWGFDSECVILCRGAIDTAFRDAVDDAACRAANIQPTRYGYTLANRIDAAVPGLVNSDLAKAARRVKTRGDKAVHYDPEGTEQIVETIRDTVRVIQSLTRAGA